MYYSYSFIKLFLSSTAPSAPHWFTLGPAGPTQLSAMWLRPIPTNGIINNYQLYCRGSDMQFYTDQVQPPAFTQTFNGSVTSTIVIGLLPFTRYECSVSARTGAGEGNRSLPKTQRTDEDGMYVFSLYDNYCL